MKGRGSCLSLPRDQSSAQRSNQCTCRRGATPCQPRCFINTMHHQQQYHTKQTLTTQRATLRFSSLSHTLTSLCTSTPSFPSCCFNHTHHGLPDTFTACQVYEATSEPERQRQNAIHEFIKTEVAFRDDLDVLLSQYAVPGSLVVVVVVVVCRLATSHDFARLEAWFFILRFTIIINTHPVLPTSPIGLSVSSHGIQLCTPFYFSWMVPAHTRTDSSRLSRQVRIRALCTSGGICRGIHRTICSSDDAAWSVLGFLRRPWSSSG